MGITLGLTSLNSSLIKASFVQFFNTYQLQKADVNGDGFLSADEYYRILKDHGIDCTYEEIMQIMQVADKDHDGKIR